MHQSTCSHCDRKVQARGLCGSHYKQWWQENNTLTYTCTHCGVGFRPRYGKQKYCTPECQRPAALVTARLTANDHRKKGTDIAVRVRPRVWLGTETTGSVWVQGPCAYCSQEFTARAGSIYCSPRCNARSGETRRAARYGTFAVTDTLRLAIYARDKHTCQLCDQPVDMTLHYNDTMAATLDHIEPQSWALIADHSERNLRLAHRICNSIRGNRA